MEKTRACGGQIWEALDLITAKPSSGGGRRVVVEKGEFVEFRFWNPANFRTVDALYLQVEPDVFYQNFKYIGRIFSQVSGRNENTTKEILDGKLYEEAEDNA